MLTLRKIRVASARPEDARRAAAYVLDPTDSPQAFAARGDAAATSAVWLGSPRMVEMLGVRREGEVSIAELALALQGRHAVSGERVRREGWIDRIAVGGDGHPEHDRGGRRRKTRVLGTKSVDLTFSAPKSVSVVWSQATPELRASIESAMLAAAEAMLELMTLTKPIVAHRRALGPAYGFVAAAALHVRARAARAETVPAPQLHVHGVLLGVERADAFFASPELSGLFKQGAPLEGGAAARAKLAELLVEMGFEIEPDAGRQGRYFEIRRVPLGLLARLSGRTREVETGITEREAAKGRRLSQAERAVVALETRAPKSGEASPEQTAAVWRAQAEDFDFGPASVDALRSGLGFSRSLERRRASVRAAALKRMRLRGGTPLSVGASRATVLESAAGRLRLDEASALLDEMQRSGEVTAAERR